MYKNTDLFTFWHSNQMLLVTCDVPNMDSRQQIVIITCVCLMIWYTQREINDVLTMNLACWSLDEWAKISRFLGRVVLQLDFHAGFFFRGKKKSIIKILHDYYSKSHTLKNVRTTLIIYRREIEKVNVWRGNSQRMMLKSAAGDPLDREMIQFRPSREKVTLNMTCQNRASNHILHLWPIKWCYI